MILTHCVKSPSVPFPEAGSTEERIHSVEYGRSVVVCLKPFLEGSILLLRDSKTPQSVQLSSDP